MQVPLPLIWVKSALTAKGREEKRKRGRAQGSRTQLRLKSAGQKESVYEKRRRKWGTLLIYTSNRCRNKLMWKKVAFKAIKFKLPWGEGRKEQRREEIKDGETAPGFPFLPLSPFVCLLCYFFFFLVKNGMRLANGLTCDDRLMRLKEETVSLCPVLFAKRKFPERETLNEAAIAAAHFPGPRLAGWRAPSTGRL